ncbi:MAG: macro domain-containing protein [Planctomycetaceae bacterium]
MLVQFGGGRIELSQGDITRQQVDAIVNAANSQLMSGGGVDGAIHRAAGSLLKEQTSERYPDGCPTGDAVVTDAGNLEARYVFHAVGPVWKGGTRNEAKLLAAVHRRCLELAVEHGCSSIAFPAISTGAYRYPVDQAAGVSLRATAEFLIQHGKPLLVRFVLFDGGMYGAFARVLESMAD